jgi:hypothetical protein
MKMRGTLVCAAMMAAAGAAHGEIYTRVAVLTGMQETPPVSTPAMGCARFVIDTDTNTVTYRIVFTGLTAPETAAHIHGMAAPGAAAGVLVPLPAGNVKVGSFMYPEAQENDLLNGLAYVNIHSAAFGGGEIRGQIVSAVAVLDGGQEVPPVPTPAAGIGLFTINPNTNTVGYYIAYAGLTSAETGAHIHGFSLPGAAAGVKVPLPAGNPKVGSFVYPEADEEKYIDGLSYVNIHTVNFGGGEIRGQIVSSVNPMDGQQETPSINVPGAGCALISLDRTTNTAGYDIQFAGLTSGQTAAHIHGWAPAGTAAGVVHNLGTGTPRRGTWAYGAANAANFTGGLSYVNVHTAANGGGELRGQINLSRLLPCSPLITTDPTDVTVADGGTAMFTVAADPRGGGALTYQWRRGATPMIDGGPFSGTGTATLTISPATAAEAGVYSCRVTNSCGSVLSDGAMLVIAPACDPDLNQDGNVDQDDIAYLINVVGGGGNPTGIDPDFNQDGNVDQDDVSALINTVGGGGCP